MTTVRKRRRRGSSGGVQPHFFEISESVALLEQATEANQRQIQQVAENTSRQISELAVNTDRQLREIALGGEKRGTEFQNEMKALANEFARSRQTNWPLIIAFITLVLMFIGGAYQIVNLSTQVTMAPVVAKAGVGEKDREDLRKGQSDNATKLVTVNTLLQVLIARLTEVETQFRMGDKVRNIQFADQQRMNNLLMQLAQGGGKEHPLQYPSGPFYHPETTDGKIDQPN